MNRFPKPNRQPQIIAAVVFGLLALMCLAIMNDPTTLGQYLGLGLGQYLGQYLGLVTCLFMAVVSVFSDY